MDGDKRGMGLSDYNGEMRKGGRGGGGGVVFRSPGSKEVGPPETGPYYDKVACHSLFFFLLIFSNFKFGALYSLILSSFKFLYFKYLPSTLHLCPICQILYLALSALLSL